MSNLRCMLSVVGLASTTSTLCDPTKQRHSDTKLLESDIRLGENTFSRARSVSKVLHLWLKQDNATNHV
jgi:hypothetical protein